MHLQCSSTDCAATFELHERLLACRICKELLDVVVGAVTRSPADLKRDWLMRKSSYDPRDISGVWRFREFLPEGYDEIVTMGEGNNPLISGRKAAAWSGLRNLKFKHLGWNPTACFKDLGMTVGVTEAMYVGATIVGCASTGNTAASLAAYAARAGLKARLYLPAGQVSMNKLAQAMDFGAELVHVGGSFDVALEQLLADPDHELYFLNSINPFRLEGQKMVMFEMMEQLGWEAPDYIVVPGGNLGNSSAFGKGLIELQGAGLLNRLPRMVIVQAEGANPLARMWRSGASELTPVDNPETSATAIRIGNPRSWKKALRALRDTDGLVTDVSDEEIAEAKVVIGRDGLGCEPASATTLAGLRKLVAQGAIGRDASVVAILTGHALKDTDFILKSQQQETVMAGGGVGMSYVHSSLREFEIAVPGSIANLGPGFDTLAVAVRLYLRIKARVVPGCGQLDFHFVDHDLRGENCIERAYRYLAGANLGSLPSLSIEVRSDIPIGSGLGSSAAATVAGLRLCQAVAGAVSQQKMLAAACALEGHPDNACTALLGGLTACCQLPDGSIAAARFSWPESLRFVVLTPEVSLQTKFSRTALPAWLPMADAVHNLQRLALLLHALQAPDFSLLKEALSDRVHQPARQMIVPGLKEALELQHPDLLGLCLSGAGPSIVALAERNLSAISELLQSVYTALGIGHRIRILKAHQEDCVPHSNLEARDPARCQNFLQQNYPGEAIPAE